MKFVCLIEDVFVVFINLYFNRVKVRFQTVKQIEVESVREINVFMRKLDEDIVRVLE